MGRGQGLGTERWVPTRGDIENILCETSTKSWARPGKPEVELKERRNGSLGSLGDLSVLAFPSEVVADETPAVQAVLRADTKRLKLLEEERRLQRQLEQGDDTAAERLEKVEEMAQGTWAETWEFLEPLDMCPLLPPPGI